jgi:MFS transporter, DHA1 family, inner membrane transport protein
MNKQQQILVFLFAFLNFTHVLDFMIMMPLGVIIMPTLGVNSTEFSYVVAAYPITAFASSLAGFFYADTVSRKKLLLIAYAGFLVGTFLCGMANSYTYLLLARSLTGLFGGLIGAQVLSMIAEAVNYEHRAKAMGILMGGFSLASVVGIPLSMYLATKFSWGIPFYAVAIIGACFYPALVIVIPNMKPAAEKGRGITVYINILKRIFTTPITVYALLFSGLLMLGHFIIIPLINPYMTKNVGLPETAITYVYLVGGICSVLAGIVIGKLADKQGKQFWFTICAIASTVLVLTITNLPPQPLWVVLVIIGAWFFTATGRIVPANAMITQSVPNEIRGSFMSLNSCVQQLGTGLASLLSGIITWSDDKHWIYGYHYLGYVSVCVIIICIFMSKRLNKYIMLQ